MLRYRGTPLAATVDVIPDGAVLRLAAPALVAPGQAVVFYGARRPQSGRTRDDDVGTEYDRDEVVGGGIVRAVSPG